MEKKAGLIVGGSIILLAIIVCVIATSSKNAKEKQPAVATTQQVTQQVAETTPIASTPTQSNAPVGNSSFVTIDQDTLPMPQRRTEVGVVQSKDISLIGGTLYYTCSLLVGKDNIPLTHIVSANGYTAIATGDKVKVSLAIYTVSNGSTYYLIEGISTID